MSKLILNKFVAEELNDIKVVEGNIETLKQIYDRFVVDFPSGERKEYSHLERLIEKNKYRLLLAKHKISDLVIGYAFVYNIPDSNALWLDYMAIDKKFQNSGYGTLLFNKIAELRPENSVGMFLEVEIPVDCGNHNSNQNKRIRFYERLGAKRLNISYKLPTDNGGYPLYLYFRPSSTITMLPKESIKASITSVYGYIHTDILDRDKILKEFIDSAKDEYFM